MADYDPADLVKPHPKKFGDAILDVILAWPLLELGLTRWIGLALNVRPSEIGILLGAMDTKNKIGKLKALYTHRDDDEAVQLLKAISKEHDEHAETRNTIIHARLMGASRSRLSDAYFLTSRAMPDEYGRMAIECISIDQIKAARRFATDRARDIRLLLKKRGSKDD